MQDYIPAKDLLRERVILVTGAGSGIGQAAAKAFAEHGATVVLLGRHEGRLEVTYDAIEAAGWPTPALIPFDLEKAPAEDYYALGESLFQEFGQLHGLLHNAAKLALLSRIDDFDPATWNSVIQVNLTAAFLLTQACLPLLRKADDASILFTSDRVGRKGRAYWGAYGVSKFAIEGLMQTLADELENSHIRVNSIAPGPTQTALRAWAYPGEDPSALPLPDSLMNDYLYLMGADSKALNGRTLSAGADTGTNG
ncbi:MAG: YciK family oxidoreductase [gamma proteobacterium symbiont of Ctena orbiculata]|uniref:YciK family oxidoreductase n=1 Tax=Candidatus Thiodiazotropha taylori TaxID=2792791 RepID=A0A944MCU7_9GAMM|nr:YciK family oxidoreductase [Candidatus Thiodiazotropha taylori]PUB81696.1 MAG: YciK family oxidoreductase [gamma proteobacterium symbiont of Ctena orbiculata]MBT2988665.1 YciK family oxidoreductase [Candidatus Thiodiazotropha taylori]MBT2996766.1 YciK family oxidoreductase [Candidatus Thiodiazotropha taylori]MBT3001999.1 YciK family oxidoreductase [Candidatus Thiodiazotropha taylori]